MWPASMRSHRHSAYDFTGRPQRCASGQHRSRKRPSGPLSDAGSTTTCIDEEPSRTRRVCASAWRLPRGAWVALSLLGGGLTPQSEGGVTTRGGSAAGGLPARHILRTRVRVPSCVRRAGSNVRQVTRAGTHTTEAPQMGPHARGRTRLYLRRRQHRATTPAQATPVAGVVVQPLDTTMTQRNSGPPPGGVPGASAEGLRRPPTGCRPTGWPLQRGTQSPQHPALKTHHTSRQQAWRRHRSSRRALE